MTNNAQYQGAVLMRNTKARRLNVKTIAGAVRTLRYQAEKIGALRHSDDPIDKAAFTVIYRDLTDIMMVIGEVEFEVEG